MIAVPVSAKNDKAVGERIDVLYHTPDEYGENEPFHIRHGWLIDPNEGPPGKYDFDLFVDGVYVKENYKTTTVIKENEPVTHLIQWTHNYPDGMTGVHTFTGRWYAPCGAVQDSGCKNQAEPVLVHEDVHIVTFIP